MRGIPAFLILSILACAAVGCAAPVKIAPFPGPNVGAFSPEVCAKNYDAVQVMGSFPTNRKYEEIGYMVLEQHSTSELVYTSEEKQILEARKKACEWGADAIVMTGGAVDKGSSFWTGYQDQRSNRVVAIRFLEADDQPEESAQ